MTTVFAYWPIRGIAQPYRFLLEYLDVKFENKPLTRESWQVEKVEFLKTDPLANVPYLKDGDKVVFESSAIGIYLVHKHNRADLLGSTLDEKVLVQQATGVLEDARKNGMKVFWMPKDQFAEGKGKQMFRDGVDGHAKKLDTLLQGKKFIGGDNVTLVDFLLYEFTDLAFNFDGTFLDNLPNLKQQHQNFREIPQIQAYIASDRFQERPFFPTEYANWG